MYEPESDTDKGKTPFENEPESFFSHFTMMDEQHTHKYCYNIRHAL